MVGTGVPDAQCWSGYEVINPHPRAKENPQKDGRGGGKFRLGSNPIPARDAQGAQTNLV